MNYRDEQELNIWIAMVLLGWKMNVNTDLPPYQGRREFVDKNGMVMALVDEYECPYPIGWRFTCDWNRIQEIIEAMAKHSFELDLKVIRVPRGAREVVTRIEFQPVIWMAANNNVVEKQPECIDNWPLLYHLPLNICIKAREAYIKNDNIMKEGVGYVE